MHAPTINHLISRKIIDSQHQTCLHQKIMFPRYIINHYQKINKYKQKYRGNISIGKFPRDFTDRNIPSVYTKAITVGKKFKTKQKKNDDVPFFTNGITDGKNSVGKLWTLFIMSIKKGITDGIFRRYFLESSRTVHLPIALLIIVLCWCYLLVFWKNSIDLKFSFKYYRRIIDGLKNRR